MFATLLGSLPRPTADAALDDEGPVSVATSVLIERAIRAQEAAGLEPVTDGRLGDTPFARLIAPELAVEAWQRAAGLTDRAVKQAIPGPYSLGRLPDARQDPHQGAQRQRRTLELAEAIGAVALALAAAGCQLIEIEESEAHRIGDDERERQLFMAAHRRLTDGVAGTHLALSIVGGAADEAGVATILDAPYASLALDLIAGPDNWNLVARTPGDRGIVAGALSAGTTDEPREVLLWAAHYAASTGGRGIARVGLGSAGSWANLTWEVALRKLQLLGDAARLATLPPGEELARSVVPASISARRAAVGTSGVRGPRTRR